jgi:endo-1,4-beta-xylanase
MLGLHSRRAVMASALALAACSRPAKSQTVIPDGPLKSLADFPVGCCVQVSQLDDPDFAALLSRHFSQLTPEWEMKMEYIVQPDGSFQFDRPDRIAGFAREHGMRLYGTTLIWYAQKPDAFVHLDPSRATFGQAYDNYIAGVVGRYQGAAGWDVVNEPVAEDGNGWRQSLWAERLGDFDHMVRAFHVAQAADPTATLFINDYNLDSLPAKLSTYQRLIEKLLAAGAPVSGIGCQTHANADLAPGAIAHAIQALAGFGLPIHVSEMDVSVARAKGFLTSRADLETRQARLYEEAGHAFASLPPKQRFAFTLWGLRDKDSWLHGENAGDTPVLFDDAGEPKPAFAALAKGFAQ